MTHVTRLFAYLTPIYFLYYHLLPLTITSLVTFIFHSSLLFHRTTSSFPRTHQLAIAQQPLAADFLQSAVLREVTAPGFEPVLNACSSQQTRNIPWALHCLDSQLLLLLLLLVLRKRPCSTEKTEVDTKLTAETYLLGSGSGPGSGLGLGVRG